MRSDFFKRFSRTETVFEQIMMLPGQPPPPPPPPHQWLTDAEDIVVSRRAPPHHSFASGMVYEAAAAQLSDMEPTEAARLLEYELRQLDLASATIHHGAAVDVYDRQTSRAVTAALLALQRRANDLEAETVEQQREAARLEEKLAVVENNSMKEKLSASTASNQADSKAALRVALMEGEIDRCERESSSLREEITTLREERNTLQGKVTVAIDRADLAEEKMRIEEESLKQHDSALSVVTGRLAAISATLGRLRPLNSELVETLRRKHQDAEKLQKEAAEHRRDLERKVQDTHERLASALGHLDDCMSLMGDENMMHGFAKELRTAAWREVASSRRGLPEPVVRVRDSDHGPPGSRHRNVIRDSTSHEGGERFGVSFRSPLETSPTPIVATEASAEVRMTAAKGYGARGGRRHEAKMKVPSSNQQEKIIEEHEATSLAPPGVSAHFGRDVRETFEKLVQAEYKRTRPAAIAERWEAQETPRTKPVNREDRSGPFLGVKEAWETQKDYEQRAQAWNRMLRQQKKQTESWHEMIAQQQQQQQQQETSDAEPRKEESNEEDVEYDHTAASTNQLQTRMSRTRVHTERINSPPPALSPLRRRPPPSGEIPTAGDKLFRPIAVQVRSNSAAREKKQEQEQEFRHVLVQTKKSRTIKKKARSHHRRKVSGAIESLVVGANHESHSTNQKNRSKPKTKDGFFSWLP